MFLNPGRAYLFGMFILEGKKEEHVEERKKSQLEKGITVSDEDKKGGS